MYTHIDAHIHTHIQYMQTDRHTHVLAVVVQSCPRLQFKTENQNLHSHASNRTFTSVLNTSSPNDIFISTVKLKEGSILISRFQFTNCIANVRFSKTVLLLLDFYITVLLLLLLELS